MARPRFRWLAASGVLAVALTVGAVALPALADDSTGAVTGHFTDAGAAVSAGVSLRAPDFSFFANTRTDESGGYTFSDVPPGSYTLEFDRDGGPSQFAVQKLNPDEADLITVAAGQTTVVEEQLVPHGSITGHVVNQDGTPSAGIQVEADGNFTFAITGTDDQGAYTLPVVPGGDYRVSFVRPGGGPTQYANNTFDSTAAATIQVNSGAATTVDQTLLPVGTITGTLTDHGQPVDGAFVVASPVNGSGSGFAATQGGNFQLVVAPGTYRVSFQLPNGLTQYAHERSDFGSADLITVDAGQTVQLDETVLRTGTIRGRLTDHDGNPVPFANINMDGDSGGAAASTDENGDYQASVFAGDYRVKFSTPFGVEFAHAKTSGLESDVITVGADATVVVDETLNQTGSATVKAVDSVTHAPVAAFCASLDGLESVCTTNGSVDFAQVLPGQYGVDVNDPNDPQTYLFSRTGGTIVASGQHTDVTITLTKFATVTTRIVDAKSGAPVAQACLSLAPAGQPNGFGNGQNLCADANGRITIPGFTPGQYKAFVSATDGAHGSQWVGPGGGVGAFKQARTVMMTAGTTTTIPTVKLDKAGSITGVVKDSTGAPIPLATVGVTSLDLEGSGQIGVQADENGRYTLTGLGPYDWTLFFTGGGQPSVWSGGTTNRDKATPVPVKVGKTTTYNIKLPKGTQVTGRVLGPDGGQAFNSQLVVYNAVTGDVIGTATVTGPTFTYQLQVAGPQKIKFHYFGFYKDDLYDGFAGGPDFASATAFDIPASGTKTIDISMTHLNP